MTLTPTRTPTATHPTECIGDCDGSGDVQINEIISCVNIALGTAQLSPCASCDADGDGEVAINELILAVNAALNGCSVPGATPTPVPRFIDNGDGTVSDNQTGLMWEKKTGAVGGSADYSNPDNVNNWYNWSASGTAADGTVFTDFLPRVNGTHLGGHTDWRLPTIDELQTILLAAYPCGTHPCIDAVFGPTQSYYYWSASTLTPYPDHAWIVSFNDGYVNNDYKPNSSDVRAVRSGL
jgi:hypothetical protein